MSLQIEIFFSIFFTRIGIGFYLSTDKGESIRDCWGKLGGQLEEQLYC
jgi:hypothetical protein